MHWALRHMLVTPNTRSLLYNRITSAQKDITFTRGLADEHIRANTLDLHVRARPSEHLVAGVAVHPDLGPLNLEQRQLKANVLALEGGLDVVAAQFTRIAGW